MVGETEREGQSQIIIIIIIVMKVLGQDVYSVQDATYDIIYIQAARIR
jgi:hypothetical protein